MEQTNDIMPLETIDSSVDVQPEKEEIPPETTVAPVEVQEVVSSVLNCPDCDGTGLVKNGREVEELCPKCQGTGKVS